MSRPKGCKKPQFRYTTAHLKTIKEMAGTYQAAEIAEAIGAPVNGLKHFCARHGIRIPHVSKLQKHIDTIKEMSGLYTGAEIAEELDCAPVTLRAFCARKGISLARVRGKPGSVKNETTYKHGHYSKEH